MRHGIGRALIAGMVAVAMASPAPAYLFWTQPKLKGDKVKGDEPGITVALKGANAKEVSANLLWAMRAGLNVAALQCQFSPGLQTVNNYNQLVRGHVAELKSAYDVLQAYFKRTGGRTWQTALDQFTTQTYNGFSTLRGQLEFCDTAASIGRDAAAVPVGKLLPLAQARMREFRNSLLPFGDASLAYTGGYIPVELLPRGCFDRKGRMIACAN